MFFFVEYFYLNGKGSELLLGKVVASYAIFMSSILFQMPSRNRNVLTFTNLIASIVEYVFIRNPIWRSPKKILTSVMKYKIIAPTLPSL